ncbi:MAG: hypothetical protein GY861_03440 [bacterium]|nr:hypothetical protein [bacterium]
MKKQNWIWMPHPGHFICSRDCRFFLNTYVGGYVVSTVGEHFPDSRIREIFAESRGKKIEGKGDVWDADYMKKIGYEELGVGRLYETMVFKAQKSKRECCPWEMVSGMDIDSDGYNDAGKAFKGHLKMCRKWNKKSR